MYNYRAIRLKQKIYHLLDYGKKSLSVAEISGYVREPNWIVNLSLAELLREGRITIQTQGQQNVVCKATENSTVETELALTV